MTGAPATVIVPRTTAVSITLTGATNTASAAEATTNRRIATHTCRVTLAVTTPIPGIGVSARAKAGSPPEAGFRLRVLSSTLQFGYHTSQRSSVRTIGLPALQLNA